MCERNKNGTFKKGSVNKNKLTLNQVLDIFKEKHGDKFDYSLIKEYKNGTTKMPIICKVEGHGIFYSTYTKHGYMGQVGCNLCTGRNLTTEQWIEKVKKKHNKDYDYSKVDYKGSKTEVTIVCKVQGHGDFSVIPSQHMSNGSGCPKCANKGLSNKVRIQKLIDVHGDKYDFSESIYTKSNENIEFVCKEHGKISMLYSSILQGQGCYKCRGFGFTNEERVQHAIDIHGDKYDYSKYEYINATTKTIVICKKQSHGEFEVTPNDHVNNNTGCPKCGGRSKGEETISKVLDEYNIKYKVQYRFDNCIGNSGVTGKYSKKLPFDFYLPEFNCCIEYDGRQHYVPVYGEEQLKIQQSIDNIKNEYCKKNKISLIRIKSNRVIKGKGKTSVKYVDTEIRKELGNYKII